MLDQALDFLVYLIRGSKADSTSQRDSAQVIFPDHLLTFGQVIDGVLDNGLPWRDALGQAVFCRAALSRLLFTLFEVAALPKINAYIAGHSHPIFFHPMPFVLLLALLCRDCNYLPFHSCSCR
ncbi:hypothetical protein CAY96_35160, partial [Pseudomonas aeruginosa]